MEGLQCYLSCWAHKIYAVQVDSRQLCIQRVISYIFIWQWHDIDVPTVYIYQRWYQLNTTTPSFLYYHSQNLYDVPNLLAFRNTIHAKKKKKVDFKQKIEYMYITSFLSWIHRTGTSYLLYTKCNGLNSFSIYIYICFFIL